MSATDMTRVGRPLPKLAAVEPTGEGYGITLGWAEGERVGLLDTIDLAPLILTFKVLKPLRGDPDLFRRVRIGDFGASIVWDGYDDLDIGAEQLEELAEQAMTSDDFAAFLKRNNLSLDGAAAQLGISRRLAAYYARERSIPRHIALACRYLDRSLAGSRAPLHDATRTAHSA